MAVVDRYKKPGGFVQLLKLIEGCGKVKREKFIEIIRAETPPWADAVESKRLTFERILSWPTEIVLDVLSKITHTPFVVALKSISEDDYVLFVNRLSHQEKRKIELVFSEIKPSPGEISSSIGKVLEETRDLITTNFINLERFEPELLIPYNYEITLSAPPVSEEELKEAAKPSETEAVPVSGTVPKNKESKLIFVGNKTKVEPPFSLATENRPEVLKSKLREIAHQLANLRKEYACVKEELEELKKKVA